MRSLELIMLEKMIISLFITILLILKIKVDIYIKFLFSIIKLDNNEIDEQENRVLSKKVN